MSKHKPAYTCTNCGYQALKWLGSCPSCNMWNTLEQEAITAFAKTAKSAHHTNQVAMTDLTQVTLPPVQRMLSGIKEWDRVTGGGIVPGGFMIITGDPGIGKSTLLLQIAYQLSQSNKIFYFSSEESLEQVKLRAERLNCISSSLLFSDQSNLDDIITTVQNQKPDLVIIDSIQNCFLPDAQTAPGSIGQLKEAAFKLMRLAKEHAIAILISGHITKEGVIAGPKMLEHMVDAVFYLQGEDKWQARILRSVKNRFGTIHELGFFNMEEHGLQEVPNINKYLLDDISYSPGSALISYIEGSRPLLIELQALVLSSKYSTPQRIISGIDPTQVILISAILEKYLQIKLSSHDLCFKVSGSFKIKSNAADLGIALALLSSYFQKPLPKKSIALGEISLTGQIKPINFIGMHIGEAEKFGIEHILLAKNQKADTSCKTTRFHSVYELVSLFGED
jgi:DNA repair protein RadA/Sms